MDGITIARADLNAEASRALVGSLNDELRGVYSEPGATHFRLDPDEVTDGRGVFLIVYRDEVPVGCGALRLLDAGTAELKRMYVIPAARGKGLGRRLLTALEAEARALGVRQLVLETGVRQAAALALYRATGFQPIPLYGEYCLSPETSVCLGKELSDPAADQSRVPKRFSAYIGGFMGASYKVELRDGALTYTTFESQYLNPQHTLIIPTEARWRDFRQSLDDLKVWQWQTAYRSDGVEDGTQWSLDIAYADQTLKTQGDNSYPDATGRPNGKPSPTTFFRRYLAAVRKLIGGKSFQ